MAVLATDDFTDVNGTLLQAHNTGVVWTRHPTMVDNFVIDTNRIRSASVGATKLLYFSNAIPDSPDYDVVGNIQLLSNNFTSEIGIAGRIDTVANSYYYAALTLADEEVQLGKYVAGVLTILSVQPVAIGSADMILSMVGDQISLTWNTTTILSVTDASIAGVGRPGVHGFNSCAAGAGIQLNSWQVSAEVEPPSSVVRSTFMPRMIGRM